MIKTGVVNSQTPSEQLPTLPAPGPGHEPANKQAADQLEDHVTVRAAETVRAETVKTRVK